jgi:hypothetical protein
MRRWFEVDQASGRHSSLVALHLDAADKLAPAIGCDHACETRCGRRRRDIFSRTTVSLVAHTLQAAVMIQYRRGNIHVLNVHGLRESARECYTTVRKRMKNW